MFIERNFDVDKRINVLIAEANFNYGMKLAKYLKIKNCNARNLNHCNNIENLFDKIEKYKPDVLICNAQLFYCDIVWLVKKIKSIQTHIHLILLMPRKDWRIENLAKKDYITCIYMPYDFYKIYEEIIIKSDCINKDSTMNRIQFFVRNMGIDDNLDGFEYTCSAIYITLFENKGFASITREIYPEIAERHGSTYNNVERCIRNCIKLFMEDLENNDCFRHFMSKYSDFAYRSCKIDCKITNARFIELMAGTFKDYCMQ